MKSIKYIALSAILTFSAICAVVYTSCKKDACKDVTCLHGGVCSDGNCINCNVGYEGTNCATLSKDKFVGTYTGSEICTVGTDNYSVTLSSASDDLVLTYTNLYNESITATCTITSTSTFSFSGTQVVGGTPVTFTGTGTLSSSNLTVTYTITNSSTTNTCTFTGHK
jgi:hypothetical protein